MKKTLSYAALCLTCGLFPTSAQLFTDNFTRGTDPAALTAPWQIQSGSWVITGGALNGGPNAGAGYGFAYVATNSWTNYSVQAQIRFSSSNAYGGGIGGRLDSVSGAHYAAWVYPETSVSGLSSVLKLIRFSDWANYVQIAADLPLPGVGTNAHTLKLQFQGSQISVFYDGNQLTNLTDTTYSAGGIVADMWSDPPSSILYVDNVTVELVTSVPVANNDSYNSVIGTTLTVSAPGVLGNDSGGAGPLSAVLVSGPIRGNFSLNANGGFTYTATNNYTGPDSFTYRANDGVTNSGIATVSITVTTNTPPVASPDIFTLPSNQASTIAAPGVLANDTDVNGNTLTAVLAVGPTNGALSLGAGGGFLYTPNNNYVGPDAFTYRANDGLSNSGVALVSISVLPPGQLFADNFSRGTNPGPLTPWQTNVGLWTVTGGELIGGTNAPFNYGYAYIDDSWSSYSVQARFRFSNSNAWGGGIGGRLVDPINGAHYAAWVYPDGSAGGSNSLVLIKFPTYTSLSYTILAQVPLGSVGTNFHTVKLAFADNQIGIWYDGVLRTNVTDGNSPFLSGGITADMWTDGVNPYAMTIDDVVVNKLAVDDYYNAIEDTLLTVGASGVLTNDNGISGGALTATLVSGPANGTLLSLGPDGSFTYLAATNYVGPDSFTYQANDGAASLGTATVNISVAADSPISRVFYEDFDGVTAPALPAGWTTSTTGVQSNWVIQAATSDSAPNSAFSPDPNNVGLNQLVSPTIALPTGQARLAFRNNYNLEAVAGNATNAYDGGVLEIKIGAGEFTDILTAGGSFVSGGYNRVIVGGFGNSLSNRLTWSGNSGGYISTLVNLPGAAAGQAIQLRWRCSSDNSTAAIGWRIDTISITNCSTSGCWNTPPAFAAQTNRTIVELSPLTVTMSATEFDLPPNSVAYSLVTSPAGATINTNTGVITWTPTEAQGPSTNTFRTRALDNGSPPLSSTNVFIVTVTETNNNAPVLTNQPNRTIVEATLLTVTNRATDADLPTNTLAHSLLVAPTGATINTNTGVITWTPSDSFGNTTNTFTTRVVDNVAPTLSATNTFLVTVLDTNNFPILLVQTNRTIAELTTLIVTNTATDTDIPTNSFVYSLLVSPASATISTNGVITWSPGEADGPSTNTFTTRVMDNGSPVKNTTNTFMVVVTELNLAPAFVATPANQTINELTLLVLTNAATDADLPANVLLYTLVNPSGNAMISTNGVITWTPQENEGLAIHVLTSVVSDGAVSVTNSFTVAVTEANSAPAFVATPANQTIGELTLLTVTNNATDADLPANLLTYTLVNPPGNAAISTNGVITWTSQETEGPATNVLTSVVSDGLVNVTNNFEVVVSEVNGAPAFVATPSNQTIAELTPLTVTNNATDTDLPVNALSYQLVNPPTGAFITDTGVIHWTPNVTQGPGSNIFITVVSDGTASVTNNFEVVVTDTLIGSTTNRTLISPGAVWRYLDDGSDQGSAWRNGGFADASWSNGPAQLGYGDGDEQTVVSFGTNSSAKYITTYFRRAFEIADRTYFSALNLRVLRDDGVVVYLNGAEVYRNNLPAGAVTYETVALGAIGGADETNFLSAPLAATGLVNGTNVVAVEIHQNVATSSDLSFDLELTGVLNLIAPALLGQPDRTVAELTTLMVTNTAVDPDTPANQLSYSLVNAPGNAVIDANGVITWTPQENEGPGTNVLTSVVSDGAVNVTNSFEVVVSEVNLAPAFVGTPANQTIDALTLLTVTNVAGDSDLPANLLSYTLDGPLGAVITNGVITWTPGAGQGGSTNTLTTIVTDDGVPPLSATNSFTVIVPNSQPVVPPVIQTTVLSNDIITITWSAVATRSYRLQSVTNLGSTDWLDVGPEVVASGVTASQTNSVIGEPQKFFRVRLAP